MKYRHITLKAGTLILQKCHGLLRTLFSKIFKKELPYNKVTLVSEKTTLVTIKGVKDNLLLLIPKKDYSAAESVALHMLVYGANLMDDDESPYLERNIKNSEDVYYIIEMIRPQTIPEKNNLDALINNRHYTKKTITIQDWVEDGEYN